MAYSSLSCFVTKKVYLCPKQSCQLLRCCNKMFFFCSRVQYFYFIYSRLLLLQFFFKSFYFLLNSCCLPNKKNWKTAGQDQTNSSYDLLIFLSRSYELFFNYFIKKTLSVFRYHCLQSLYKNFYKLYLLLDFLNFGLKLNKKSVM